MAGNGKSGDNRRHGYVSERTQTQNPKTGLWTKRDTQTGQFMDVKTSGGKFKGVRKEKDQDGI
ncbi:MAG: hypothetical protein EOO43_09180 [Flavobacterium sp.]|nr:MAG: hypothetical protein EOO43_09180 [Flavobacterium sp.]